MSVRLLGTGAADGWPNPFCTCSSCTSERLEGRTRTQTSALVDDVLLLDCGPGTPHAAERAGVTLREVRFLLITHQHSDHCSPATLMYRSWVVDGPLTVVGPPDVIEACRPWLPEDTGVVFRPVRPGDELDLEGYAVRVLASSHRTGLGTHSRPGTQSPDAVLFDVTTPTGERVLYATDTGPLPGQTLAAVAGARFDVVLLEETFGDRLDLGPGHLNLATFPEQLRHLRASGAVTEDSDVVAIHLSHHNPPAGELARRLADWGVRIVDDGCLLTPSNRAECAPPVLRTLVLGGARSGKSLEAERLLATADDVTYVATSYPRTDDPEWSERVARHRRQRPARWTTVETLDLVDLLGTGGGPLLIDCLTLWLTRVMDRHDAWDDHAWRTGGAEKVEADVAHLAEAWRGTQRRVVAVSNEVGQGIVPDTASARRFRDAMGRLNARIADETEDVRWCVAGRVTVL